MRKKELRKANVKLAEDLGNAQVELADVKAHNQVLNSDLDRIIRENQQLASANLKLSQAANQALRENRELRSKQERATALFGKAMAQVQPETGPSRPNRKKLTEQEAKDIREAYYGGAKQKDLARNYGVNPATISRTVRGIYH